MRPLPPVVSDSFRQFPRECVKVVPVEFWAGAAFFLKWHAVCNLTESCLSKQSTHPPAGPAAWFGPPGRNREEAIFPVVSGPANGRGATHHR